MFWWLRYRKIINYLKNSKDSDEKKQNVIDSNSFNYMQEISHLSDEELINLLFERNLNKLLLKSVIKRINETPSLSFKDLVSLAEKRNYSLAELEIYFKECDECKLIVTLIRNKTEKEISKLLKKDENDIVKLMDNKMIPFSYKRLLITSYKNDQRMICKLLNKVKDEEVINNIIYGNKYSADVISCILFTSDIGDIIKDKIIEYQIDENNIIDILSSSLMAHNSFREAIIPRKKEELNRIIMRLDKYKILYLITQDYCKDIITIVYEKRYSDIVNIINNLPIKELLLTVSRCNYEPILELFYKLRNQDINESISKLSSSYLIEVLLSKNIREELKQEIIKIRKDEITEELKKKHKHNILTILKSEYAPNEIKDLLYEVRYDYIKEMLLELNVYEIIETYFNKSTYSRFKEDILDYDINSSNIFTILNSRYAEVEECKKIMDRKNIILRAYIKNMHPTALIKFLTYPEIPIEFQDYILSNNYDLVVKKMKEKKNDCFNIVTDLREVPSTIKKALLDGSNIPDDEIDFVFAIGKYCKTADVIDKYNSLKTFIESQGIELRLFLQYGVGSRKYKNWYIELSKIIDNHEEDKFKEVKDYLLNNYYIDTENDNKNIIRNFLEILTNYNKYIELFTYMISNNYKLTREDKIDLELILNQDIEVEIKEPKDLEKAKDEVYKNYQKRIDKNDLSLQDIKDIFNDMLFCDADSEFDKIGNKIGLLELRKKNVNSRVITDYIDSLIKYIEFIELVNDSTDSEALKDSLRLMLETNIEDFIKLKSDFNNIGNKIRRLYELESQVNLTDVKKASKLDGVLRKDLVDEYGTVLDFSDKNYVLYAHVISGSETVDELMNGVSSGEKNFISLSPISYLGQRYYYNNALCKVIFAYDKVPNGSFICSSKKNLGSNKLIKKNTSEVKRTDSYQEGILDTSKATTNNAEALFYREGMKPCGIILTNGVKPTKEELEIHKKYNIPFIITQSKNKCIIEPKLIFSMNDEYYDFLPSNSLLNSMYEKVNRRVNYIDKDIYTGREIALFTDSHSMYESTIEILEDIRKRGITEIYSLGDNIGLGPNPIEVFDMLEYYKVKSVSGNSEYYNTLGIAPFSSYFDTAKTENQLWTEEKLGSKRIEIMKSWAPSLDIKVGDKNIGLCHFINDIRWDFDKQNTWSYQRDFVKGVNSKQFLYTNSEEAKAELERLSRKFNGDMAKGVIDAIKHPIFDGKRVTNYDAILQGHVHFPFEDYIENTNIHTLRGVSVGFRNDRKDTACYYILREKKDGTFDIEKKLIRYNRHQLLENIYSSSLPHKDYLLKMVK